MNTTLLTIIIFFSVVILLMGITIKLTTDYMFKEPKKRINKLKKDLGYTPLWPNHIKGKNKKS